MTNLPATSTDPMADFQAKLRERVRNDIRDLLPEEAVAALVQKAVTDEFFTERTITDGSGWRSRDRKAPSLFVEEVIKAAKPIIDAAVTRYITNHPSCVEKVITDYLDENKMAAAAVQVMSGIMAQAVYQLEQALRR